MILKLKYRQIPLVLLLLLIIYCAIILLFAGRTLVGDEVGYSMYADNITHGFYTDSNDVNIWWDPGYPLILTLFKILHFPVILTKLFNSIFYFIAIILFYKISISFAEEDKALLFTFLLGLWPPYIRQLIYLNSEPLSCMLITIIFYCSYFLLKNKEFNYTKIILFSLALGYLAFTKAIFGYVIVACIIILILIFAFPKNKTPVKIHLFALFFAIVFCLPYLFYTYNLTGKLFFWSNGGWVNIYHSTTPFSNEYGNWLGNDVYEDNPQAKQNHKEALNETINLKALEKDDKFKELGIENLKNHPVKFIYNWFCGLGRLMFNYPFSYSYQKPDTYFFILPNMFLFTFLFISIWILIKYRKMFPYEFSFTILFSIVYLGGTSLVATVARYTALIYPLFFSIILYVFTKIIKIKINED
jgi:hypothetical protein